jgi:hypothetical protein
MMTSNNAEWERGWFYLRNEGAGLPAYSGKVLKDKADSWHHGVSPPSHQMRLDSLLAALKALADGGLTAGCVLANLHHQRIVPLMERPLRIFEMHEDADPIALAQSRLLPDLFPQEYAATRARRAIDLRAARSNDAVLWAFTMLPVGPLVSGVPPFLVLPVRGMLACFEASSASSVLQIRAVKAARSDPPMPRSRVRARSAAAGAGAGGPQEGAEHPATGAPGAKERGVPAARVAGAVLAWDRGVLVVRRGRGEGRKRWGPGYP